MSVKIVIIDDNQKLKDDALVWELKDKFGAENVEFTSAPATGLEYVKSNLDSNLIVLLDIQFPANEIDGHKLLTEIKKISQLIPVILWSGINEDKETFSDFINNHAFGFISKTATTQEAMSIIDNAVLFFETNVDNAIEDWIIKNPADKDKPVYFTSDGKSYSLNKILSEIRNQTTDGKEFAKKFNALTIDLLLRSKERLK